MLIGLMVAIVLLGPGPAALLGVGAMAVAWGRTRVRWHLATSNAAIFAWFPLAAGLFFHATVRLMHLGPDALAYYLVVFATFLVALLLNLFGMLAYKRYEDGSSVLRGARDALLPLMPAQLFSALLTMGAAYIAIVAGTVGIVLTVLVLLIFQYLVGELLKSKRRGERLEQIATTDDLTGLANRERFRARLDETIATARTTAQAFAVMLLDLDRFKEVNDTLGHH
ncbi:MAG TPA: GGDEF domain-containing protein, partial [Solirubrobacteraceae bacterium]|nr:GGDEF domain-containing protein [Solirubrobacteraceae bacterium]